VTWKSIAMTSVYLALWRPYGFMPFLGPVYASFTQLGAGLALGTGSMINRYHETTTDLPARITRRTSPRFASGPLDLTVLFTDPQGTAAALDFARRYARELGARIQLCAVLAVPHQLPLDEPPVSVAFLQDSLQKLASRAVGEGFDPSIHVYLCRDQVLALSQILGANSLIVLGGRKHWWPTEESRLARALRAKGHQVIFVDSRAAAVTDQAVFARWICCWMFSMSAL
jgi:hypothetical protein